MPVWNKAELNVVRKDGNFLNEIEFENRYTVFGGRIRFIFTDDQLKLKYFDDFNVAINSLEFDVLKQALKQTIDIDQSQSTYKVSSMIFIYDVLATTTNKYKYLKIVGNYITSIASETVRHLIACRFWKEIMQSLNPKNIDLSGDNIGNGKLFEIIAGVFLEFKVEFDAHGYDGKFSHKLQLSKGKRIEIGNTWDEFLTYCNQNLQINPSSRILAFPNTKTQPVFDLMDAKNRAYQITIGKTHGINKNYISKIINQFGFNASNVLNFYFVVPDYNLMYFKWNFEGEFENLDKDLISFESSTTTELKEEMKNLSQTNYSKDSKEQLVKKLLSLKGKGHLKTSKELLDELQTSIVISKICIPTEPHEEVITMIRSIYKLK